MNFQHILMVKSHSLGVGDVLRSSAAWRVLKNTWPDAHLHLLFLSKHAGYPTEELIRQHHLLSSATFLTIREGTPADPAAQRIPLSTIQSQTIAVGRQLQPDLVIDFEASGIRSSLVTRWAAHAVRAQTVGIAQFWGRGWFYDRVAPSMASYAQTHGLQLPMDYTERDFVALAALGLARNQTPIELQLTPDGAVFAESLRAQLPSGRRVIGLNIGCGTSDAIPKRPPIAQVAQAMHTLASHAPSTILLSGAGFEKAINQEFIQAFHAVHGDTTPVIDCAGQSSLSGLTGLIAQCDLFISSDSGPYHMAVAMQKPTVAWFMLNEPTSYHQDAWCKCLIRPDANQVVEAAQALLGR